MDGVVVVVGVAEFVEVSLCKEVVEEITSIIVASTLTDEDKRGGSVVGF